MDFTRKRTNTNSTDLECGKKKRTQCYCEAYTEKYSFIKPGMDQSRVLCEICQTEFGIKYGGIDDIRRHVEGARHEKKCKDKELAKKSQPITGFFARAPTANSLSSLELDVTRAEVTMVDLCVDLNLPMSSLDKFNKAFKTIFHDSKIAKNFQCARSKGTAIVKEMAALTTLDLAERMKSGCCTISMDGSNDSGSEKLFPLIVRTVDPKSMEVRSDALSVPAIEGSATGIKIFSLIESEFNAHNIPWENCIAFGSDNANVMVGKEAGVHGCMLKKHPELYLAGCVCHLIHIAAEKGGASLPFNPSQLLLDVFYYLEKSSKRQGDLKCCQLLLDIKETKMLKHVATRWLSIGKCLPRLIDSWDALYLFFKEEEKSFKDGNKTKRRVADLKDIFSSKTKKLYCLFLLDAIKDFEKINTELQGDKPMIQCLSQKLLALFKTLLIKFVEPAAILGQDIMGVDFNDSTNIKADSDLIVESGAFSFLGDQNIKKEKRAEFYKHVVQFNQACCSFLKKKLPFNDPTPF